MNQRSGSGVVILQDNNPAKTHAPTHFINEQLGAFATVFQAEVYAILLAAEKIRSILPTLSVKPKQVYIISDSRSAIQALGRPSTKSSLILDCKTKLQFLCSEISVTLQWIKAHVGHAGNELADSWAKKATTTPTEIVEPFLPLSLKWIKSKIDNYILREWTFRWQSTATARQTKIFFPKPNPQISKKLLSLDRLTFGQAFRWISGHNYLLRHCNLLHPEHFPNPTCRLCHSEPETSSHLLLDCPANSGLRRKIFGEFLLPTPPAWSSSQLLQLISLTNDKCPEILPHEY
jgi:ribonuclease HI